MPFAERGSRSGGMAPRLARMPETGCEGFVMSAIGRSIDRLGTYWKKKGAKATFRALVRAPLAWVIRHRCALVFEASLVAPREPSIWGPREKLLIFGPQDIPDIDPALLSTMDPAGYWHDLNSLREQDRLFVVACDNYCLHQAYVAIADQPALRHDRKRVFFGELQSAPLIRASLTTHHVRHKDIYMHVLSGLYSRVLNEQLLYLQSAGYRRAV